MLLHRLEVKAVCLIAKWHKAICRNFRFRLNDIIRLGIFTTNHALTARADRIENRATITHVWLSVYTTCQGDDMGNYYQRKSMTAHPFVIVNVSPVPVR